MCVALYFIFMNILSNNKYLHIFKYYVELNYVIKF